MHVHENEDLAQRLATSGLRMTRQRQQVFDVVAESHDHPTAEQIFERAKKSNPEISFATVYNCLSVLVECGLVRQVILDRAPVRFCPNMREHWHFYCEQCGEVLDIDVPKDGAFHTGNLPDAFTVNHVDVALRGKCNRCSSQQKN
ncbi:MAG TPA: Fur family transcriptional regulator [Verrucomicrobiae bacterium]|jgi:Fur family peroxide stress response transcriptional regulator